MKSQKLELNWYNKDKALIPVGGDGYGYAWVDQSDPRYRETHTLVMGEKIAGEQKPKDPHRLYSELADLSPTEDNLLILGESGDVLEVLTRVPELKEQYGGQVKLVYIDPPFNTSQTFKHYEDNLEHSVWLTMMRDRLEHLKDLLAEDGSIWVHLDFVENHRMRMVLDEVFGSSNFVGDIAWHKTTSSKNDNSGISQDHDTVVIYRKSPNVKWNGIDRSAASEDAYGNPDNDPRGPWREDNYKMKKGSVYPIIHPVTGKEILPPSGQKWRFSKETHQRHLREDRIWWGATGNYSLPKVKRFRSEVADFRVPDSIWTKDFADTNRRAKQHLGNLFDYEDEFDTPKPERLLERIIHIATNPGDIVLDVFGGSGTTAAVAHKMSRRWVTCELRENVFNKFTKPRLEMVVGGSDPGGSTITNERVTKPGAILPDKFETKDLQEATRLLNAVQKDDSLTEDQITALKTVKKLIATAPKNTVNWRGGGSFRVAKLSPSCFDYDSDMKAVVLTKAATGETLVTSVAAQLGFRLTPEVNYFDGVRGVQRLVVVEGLVTSDDIDVWLEHLPEGDKLIVAATAIDDGVRRYLAKKSRGSIVKHVPDDIFTVTSVMREENIITGVEAEGEKVDTAEVKK